MSKDWHDQLSQPKYEIELKEDTPVTMRDGIRLYVDVYRPKARGKFPALLSFSGYGKDQQKLPTDAVWQPSDYVRGTGGHECGEQWYFVPRGYVQVIPDIRGVGKSEGDAADYEKANRLDGYDLVEWIAKQPWCNGNVGMIGVSAFSMSQYAIASTQPPHLKAIAPIEGLTNWYRHNAYHGGVFQYSFALHIDGLRPTRRHGKPQPASFKEFSKKELQKRIKQLQNDPDIQCTPYLYLITLCPEKNPAVFDLMMHPYDGPFYQRISAYPRLKYIKIPHLSGARWNGWSVHLPGAIPSYESTSTPREQRKLFMYPTDNYGGNDRPIHEFQDLWLRWYDHWLKGNDTGMMDEPPITIFVQGINIWRFENEWPLKATIWTKFYLREGGLLSTQLPGSNERPQVFTSNPWAQPVEGSRRSDTIAKADPVPKVIYETEPLKQNLEVTGPLALYWNASIESKGLRSRSWKGSAIDGIDIVEPLSNDTFWYLKVKDIDVDGAERCVGEGILRASHYELDNEKSKIYAPYHPHTRSLSIEPGEVILYANDIGLTSNVFLVGHKIRLEIAGQDQWQALHYHLPHMAEVKHTIYSTRNKPSYLLLPVIPRGYKGEGELEYTFDWSWRIPKYKRA